MALLATLGSVYDWETDGRLRCGTIEDKSEAKGVAKGVVIVAEKEVATVT